MNIAEETDPHVPASANGRPDEADAAVDLAANLEDDCLHLAARLEHLLSRLEEAKQSGRTLPLLDRAKEMMVELLDFAESRFDKALLESPLQRTRDVYDELKKFEHDAGGQGLAGIGRLFGGVEQAEKHKLGDDAYQQLGDDLAGLCGQFFSLFADQFDDDSARARWNHCSGALLDELKSKW